MLASRPGKRVSAISAPSGRPITAAHSTADRLTISDSQTICISAGSALSTSSRAVASPRMRMILHLITRMVNFRS